MAAQVCRMLFLSGKPLFWRSLQASINWIYASLGIVIE